jgi:hypothetical protein
LPLEFMGPWPRIEAAVAGPAFLPCGRFAAVFFMITFYSSQMSCRAIPCE